jgi:hypothetical protein
MYNYNLGLGSNYDSWLTGQAPEAPSAEEEELRELEQEAHRLSKSLLDLEGSCLWDDDEMTIEDVRELERWLDRLKTQQKTIEENRNCFDPDLGKDLDFWLAECDRQISQEEEAIEIRLRLLR